MTVLSLVTLIPNYRLLQRLPLVSTHTVPIVLVSFSAFGTFLLRQFTLGIPSSLAEAAEIDGATRRHMFWDVVTPLALPGLITLAILTWMGQYQSFFWPLVMTNDIALRTLPIRPALFRRHSGPRDPASHGRQRHAPWHR